MIQTPENLDRDKIFLAAKENFKTFVKFVLGFKNQAFHDDLEDALGNPYHKKIAISFPRGHGKSTIISVALPLWFLAKNRNLRILLISATGQASRAFLSEIMGHIERNEEYAAFSAKQDKNGIPVRPRVKAYSKSKQNWSGDSITIEREQLNLKDPSINAIGLFGSILSKRADIIICDDVVNQENSATELQRNKVIDWIYTTIMPVLVPGGTFIYLGNTWHQDDLVARLLKDPQFDYKKRMPAIQSDAKRQDLWQEWAKLRTNDAKSAQVRLEDAELFYRTHQVEMDEGVSVLWPSRFSYGDLYLTRMANPYAFARMYQCNPADRPNQRFQDAWIEKSLAKGRNLKLQIAKREGMEVDCITEGVDLAISSKEGSDDTVVLVLDRVKYSKVDGVVPGDVVVREIVRGKLSPNTVRQTITEHYYGVQPDGIRVETVGYQEAIQRDLEDTGIPVHGYHTGKEKNDPDAGVYVLALLAEQGKLVLPSDPSDQRTIQLVSQLCNEMRAFPDGHTGDSLMALWFAYAEMRDLTSGRLLIPDSSPWDGIADPVDLSNPDTLRAEEKKADIELANKQMFKDEEQQVFARMMRGG